VRYLIALYSDETKDPRKLVLKYRKDGVASDQDDWFEAEKQLRAMQSERIEA
jgi:hypothetical protein